MVGIIGWAASVIRFTGEAEMLGLLITAVSVAVLIYCTRTLHTSTSYLIAPGIIYTWYAFVELCNRFMCPGWRVEGRVSLLT